MTRSWGVAVLVVVAMAGFACHGEQQVAYENATSTTVTIVIDYTELVTLEPGEREQFVVRENALPDRVLAFDQEGVLQFARTYTWEDLEQAGWEVVITQ